MMKSNSSAVNPKCAASTRSIPSRMGLCSAYSNVSIFSPLFSMVREVFLSSLQVAFAEKHKITPQGWRQLPWVNRKKPVGQADSQPKVPRELSHSPRQHHATDQSDGKDNPEDRPRVALERAARQPERGRVDAREPCAVRATAIAATAEAATGNSAPGDDRQHGPEHGHHDAEDENFRRRRRRSASPPEFQN